VNFFENELKAINAIEMVEKYVFSSDANENDAVMLIRLGSGA